MRAADVPKALQDRLGVDATEAFAFVLSSHQVQMANDILARIDARTDRLEAWLDERFEAIDKRFDQNDFRTARIEARFDASSVQREERLDAFSAKLDAFAAKQARFGEALERGFGTLRADMADQRGPLMTSRAANRPADLSRAPTPSPPATASARRSRRCRAPAG